LLKAISLFVIDEESVAKLYQITKDNLNNAVTAKAIGLQDLPKVTC